MIDNNQYKFAFHNWVVNNRMFILGAGFSAYGGIPMTGKLLRDTMTKMQQECPGITTVRLKFLKYDITSINSKY